MQFDHINKTNHDEHNIQDSQGFKYVVSYATYKQQLDEEYEIKNLIQYLYEVITQASIKDFKVNSITKTNQQIIIIISKA